MKVWSELGMKNMEDYYDLYLKTDHLLLADVFEDFKNMCLEYHGLYPFLYFSSPALSCDVVLKIAGVKLDLILFTY